MYNRSQFGGRDGRDCSSGDWMDKVCGDSCGCMRGPTGPEKGADRPRLGRVAPAASGDRWARVVRPVQPALPAARPVRPARAVQPEQRARPAPPA